MFFLVVCFSNCGRFGKEETAENKAEKNVQQYNERIKGPNDKTTFEMDKITKPLLLTLLLSVGWQCARAFALFEIFVRNPMARPYGLSFLFFRLCAPRNDLKFHFKNFYI